MRNICHSVAGSLALAFLLCATSVAFAKPHERVLYTFTGGADGANPTQGVTLGPSGVIYGTTQAGAIDDRGTVWMLTPSGSAYAETTLWNFPSLKDGAVPDGDLVIGPNGSLIGAAIYGGKGAGVVFDVPANGERVRNVIYDFKGGNDGVLPDSGLVRDAAGALYGVTEYGDGAGYGVVYKLTPSGNTYTESVIHRFGFAKDGRYPGARLTLGPNGTLFGTTGGGGNHCAPFGCGTVFELTPSGSHYTETILYNFAGGHDGGGAETPVSFDGAGNIYGTTYFGGARGCAAGCGTVYKLTRTSSGYSESILAVFADGPTGNYPSSSLVVEPDGVLYGTTSQGGSGYVKTGTIFRLTPSPSGYRFKTVWNFGNPGDGNQPEGSLAVDAAGAIYGITYWGGGGSFGEGTVFKFTP